MGIQKNTSPPSFIPAYAGMTMVGLVFICKRTQKGRLKTGIEWFAKSFSDDLKSTDCSTHLFFFLEDMVAVILEIFFAFQSNFQFHIGRNSKPLLIFRIDCRVDFYRPVGIKRNQSIIE